MVVINRSIHSNIKNNRVKLAMLYVSKTEAKNHVDIKLY